MTERGDPASDPRDGPAGPSERPPGRVVSDGGVATEDATADTGGTTEPATETDGRPTVLHVDDDPEVGLLVSEFLDRSDHDLTVLTETDAAAALERVRAGGVDCVVTDVEMPGMDGRDLVRAIADGHPGLPVVLFTSCTWGSVADETVATTVDDYVCKNGGHGQFESVADAVVGALD